MTEPKQVQHILEEMIDKLKALPPDPKVANAIGYLSMLVLKCIEDQAKKDRDSNPYDWMN